ncbi:MAG TPA: hypothetical protein VH573_09720 [Mycobacteriales bacterium]|jgi:hypothetical protein
MALTVRPDDEVYQFDTVWLGPDEYTLPIQARYVAWGTWLACFLVAAVLIIPLGGGGPAGVLGSLVWSLGLSVVFSRAIMLIVDHERPLRSLPALFSAEARAAMHSRRRGERSLLVRPRRVVVRDTPPKVLAMRERQRSKAAAKAAGKADRRAHREQPVDEVAPVEQPVPAEPTTTEPTTEPTAGLGTPAWTADTAVDDWHARRTPAWSIRADEHDVYEPAPVPVPVDDEVHEFVRAPDPETTPAPTPEVVAAAVRRPAPAPAATGTAAEPPAGPRAGNGGPFRTDPQRAESNGDGRVVPAGDEVDPHAALERRILLPARKDR